MSGVHGADNYYIATSNDPWGPTGTEMAEIAALTFNRYDDYCQEIVPC